MLPIKYPTPQVAVSVICDVSEVNEGEMNSTGLSPKPGTGRAAWQHLLPSGSGPGVMQPVEVVMISCSFHHKGQNMDSPLNNSSGVTQAQPKA